ncbi:MAG: phospholipase D-like domain-containing protein [Bacteroidetes bacterium]|nr:phospholipase D-like domain-containing protein [Bacteroidota bacterium]
MKTQVINQTPFNNPLKDELKLELIDKSTTCFRALVAYLSWRGLDTIYEELESFYESKYSQLKMIIGLGSTTSEIDVLRYLNERMPKGSFKVFNASNDNYTFHPKIYFFDKKDSLTVFIGSSNLSLGGISINSECSIKIELDRKKDNSLLKEFEDVWETYSNPQNPFKKNNLRSIDKALLKGLEKLRIRIEKIEKTQRRKSNELKKLFPELNIPAISTVSHIKGKAQSKRIIKPKVGSILFLEVLTETGANGTQVQIPSSVLENYFDVKPDQIHKTIQLKFPYNEFRPSVICRFGNYTYRFTISEITSFDRPLLLKFVKLGTNKYIVSFLRGSLYKKQIKNCTNQTRADAKHWLIK